MRHRSDHTQDAIIDALRRIGVAVQVIGEPMDLLVCHRGVTSLVECKNRDGRNRLTKGQVEFIARWPGMIHIVHTPEEAIRAVIGDEVLR